MRSKRIGNVSQSSQHMRHVHPRPAVASGQTKTTAVSIQLGIAASSWVSRRRKIPVACAGDVCGCVGGACRCDPPSTSLVSPARGGVAKFKRRPGSVGRIQKVRRRVGEGDATSTIMWGMPGEGGFEKRACEKSATLFFSACVGGLMSRCRHHGTFCRIACGYMKGTVDRMGKERPEGADEPDQATSRYRPCPV